MYQAHELSSGWPKGPWLLDGGGHLLIEVSFAIIFYNYFGSWTTDRGRPLNR